MGSFKMAWYLLWSCWECIGNNGKEVVIGWIIVICYVTIFVLDDGFM